MTTNTLRRVTKRPTVRLIVVAAVAVIFAGRGAVRSTLQAQGPNPISIENQQPGDSDWDITGSGDPGMQGFASDISVNAGQTVDFKINTNATNYTIDVYRLGYYGGAGAREGTGSTPINGNPSPPPGQPAWPTHHGPGALYCGN